MSELNEGLLKAWLNLSTAVVNHRVVTELSYNEALVCNLLYRDAMAHPEKRCTATDLCAATRMLKSQMNRTLNQLENKGIIRRERSKEDKRQVFVTMDPERSGPYREMHQKVLKLVDGIVEEIGTEKAKQAEMLLNDIAGVADRLLHQGETVKE